MSKSIVVTVPHALGVAEAKRRISERIDMLRREYIDKLAYSEVTWTGDQANVRVVAFGQTATGKLDVGPDSLKIEVELPWVLAVLANKIQGTLTSNAAESLRIEHKPPKT